jgi:hypothetical protein
MANARLQERLDAVDEASSIEPKLSPEEKELRARVCTNKARQAFESCVTPTVFFHMSLTGSGIGTTIDLQKHSMRKPPNINLGTRGYHSGT